VKRRTRRAQDTHSATAVTSLPRPPTGAASRPVHKRKQGRPARVAPARRLVVLLPPSLVEELKVHAARESTKAGRQVSASWIIEQALVGYLPRA
jgi:hypothetical protein